MILERSRTYRPTTPRRKISFEGVRSVTKTVSPLERLLTAKEVAAYLNIPVNTLYVWRVRGDEGPPVLQAGKSLRYRLADVDAWLEEGAQK